VLIAPTATNTIAPDFARLRLDRLTDQDARLQLTPHAKLGKNQPTDGDLPVA
jgi:hypothetical protein